MTANTQIINFLLEMLNKFYNINHGCINVVGLVNGNIIPFKRHIDVLTNSMISSSYEVKSIPHNINFISNKERKYQTLIRFICLFCVCCNMNIYFIFEILTMTLF